MEAIFDVEASASLTDRQKQRVLRKAGPTLRAIAQDERSQTRNRELAIERVADALREALHVERAAAADEAGPSRNRAPPRAEAPPVADDKRLRQPPRD